MDKKEFLPKLKVLELIEDNEIITPMTLVDYLDMSYSGAVKRIYRLRKAGLIEPLG